jgi:hypothetical protein
VLIADGSLTSAQVDDALEAQALYGGTLDTCIMELGLLSEPVLEAAIERAAGSPNPINARGDLPAADALALLSGADAARFFVIPFRVDGRMLDLATSFPIDLRSLDAIAFKTGLSVRPSVTTALRIAVLLEQHYQVPRPARYAELGRGAILRPNASGGDAFLQAAAPEAAEDGAPAGEMPSITMDRAHDEPEIEIARPDAAPTGKNGQQNGHAARPTAGLAAGGAKEEELRVRVPDYKPVGYTPEHFDQALADFRDDENEPTGVRNLNSRLRAVDDRDHIPDAVFLFLVPYVRRAALFSVQRGLCTGWDASGGRVDARRIRTMAFPLSHPSIFREAAHGDVFVGRMPLTKVNEEFARRMGEPRVQEVIVAPIRIRDKVVTILACDCEGERALERAFTPVVDTADKLARTLVRLILERKQAS